MPSWPIARAESVRQDLLDAENARPTLPELVSVPEAAEILGVSPQRVRELTVTNPSFPEPMYELRTGKLWLRDAIDVFASRDRKPGRTGMDWSAQPSGHVLDDASPVAAEIAGGTFTRPATTRPWTSRRRPIVTCCGG